ncbi:hypothetical protein KV205_19535 [Streptomyces sp. SKN60]|uniref:hypothetical protein n=1 Tax=Streptomyces sp. SKN60 TaxID=2855506 RepID=UPI002247D6A9|nr:hypothetical protein [Streptomyces sp. SKN60]MCX2182700.1 hypothetical protein [Streptomyces sp. SKN60]
MAERAGKARIVAAAVLLATVFFCLLPLAESAPALIALQLPNAMWIAVITTVPMVLVQQEVPGGTGAVSALGAVLLLVRMASPLAGASGP